MSDMDWTVVGYVSHPIPGDASTVRSAAKTFALIAQRMEGAANGLRKLDSEGTRSKAIDALDVQVREVEGQLRLALSRYEAAGEALSAYALVLEEAKRKAEEALAAATSAQADLEMAERHRHDFYWAAATNIDPEQRRQFVEAYRTADLQAQSASTDINSARAKVGEAVQARDEAANAAADRIDRVVEGARINDTFKDRVDKFLADASTFLEVVGQEVAKATKVVLEELGKATVVVFSWIARHAGDISLGLKILAVLTFWFPPLAIALAALSFAFSVVDVGYQVYSTISAAVRGDEQGVRDGLIGLTITLVTLGIARGVAGRVKGAQSRLDDVARKADVPKHTAASRDPLSKLARNSSLDESVQKTDDSIQNLVDRGRYLNQSQMNDRVTILAGTNGTIDLVTDVGAGQVKVGIQDAFTEPGQVEVVDARSDAGVVVAPPTTGTVTVVGGTR